MKMIYDDKLGSELAYIDYIYEDVPFSNEKDYYIATIILRIWKYKIEFGMQITIPVTIVDEVLDKKGKEYEEIEYIKNHILTIKPKSFPDLIKSLQQSGLILRDEEYYHYIFNIKLRQLYTPNRQEEVSLKAWRDLVGG